ncbi:MAG: hypothetical protein RIF37_03385 [Rhodospirillaceae bacterium]|jgi:hypothetical protein
MNKPLPKKSKLDDETSVMASRILSGKDATEFAANAAAFTARATVSKAAARKALIKLGIQTPSGNISKKYK